MVFCCGDAKDVKIDDETRAVLMSEEEVKDYDDLIHLARKREIRVTIRKGAQAGMMAGLSVMAGTIVAGPVGAAIGGACGTVLAIKKSKDVVALSDLLENTPPTKRHELVKVFQQSFAEEFQSVVNTSPEVKLVMSGMTPIAMTRYAMDKNLLKSEQLGRLDGILKKIT